VLNIIGRQRASSTVLGLLVLVSSQIHTEARNIFPISVKKLLNIMFLQKVGELCILVFVLGAKQNIRYLKTKHTPFLSL
jgi:hypothetical protein